MKGSTTLYHMWYRSGVVALLGCLSGCGDSSEGREPPTSEAEPGDDSSLTAPTGDGLPPPAEGLRLTIDGLSTQLGAKAELEVIEGQQAVRLEITGTRASDVFLMEVAFDGIESSMGTHQLEVGLPGTEMDSALASIDGQSYQSQGGQIALSLTANGDLLGNFELDLAEIVEVELGAPLAFEEGEIVRTLSGRFTGHWELYCQSRLPGHTSLMEGGDFCDALVIE
jgi:hypothetical protein